MGILVHSGIQVWSAVDYLHACEAVPSQPSRTLLQSQLEAAPRIRLKDQNKVHGLYSLHFGAVTFSLIFDLPFDRHNSLDFWRHSVRVRINQM